MSTTPKSYSITTVWVVSFFALPWPVHANTLTTGLLASFSASDYASDDEVGVVPLFLYDNDRFYVEGSEGGYYLYKDDTQWLKVGATYEGKQFDPTKATDTALQKLDKRKSSVEAHVSYMNITPVGGFEVKLATDALGNSGGHRWSLTHRSRFGLLDDRLLLYPKLGLTWYSSNHNQYYYGVSAAESLRSGVPTYTAKSSVSPFVSVSAKYQIRGRLGLFANQRVDWLSKSQQDSPLTDNTISSMSSVGLTWDW